ncbi:MAG: hypothetical protein JW902_13775 [Syntrophaceae bacterium]|nr:hypothetical protein [Syntrophaceae bacterium]
MMQIRVSSFRTVNPRVGRSIPCAWWFLFVLVLNIYLLVSSAPAIARGGEEEARSLTQALISQGAQFKQLSPGSRANLLKELLNTAASRKQTLLALIEENPAEVIRLNLSGSVRDGLPPGVQAFLERDVNVEGEIEIQHEDRNTESRYLYFLKAGGKRHSLHFTGPPPTNLLSGARVRITGIQLDTKLVVGKETANLQAIAQAPIPDALGEQRTLVILVKFQDTPIEPYPVAEAQNVFFGTTSDFFWENSYRQTWLSGDVCGWYTIPLESSACDTAAIKAYADVAAMADGVNLAAYTHLVYAFPSNSVCGFAGRSTVGGSPSLAWINGEPELDVTAHELGHGLGLWHSHSLDCGSSAVMGSSCTIIEYGDIVDMMGASHYAHFNAFQKERLGWLNSGDSPTITTVQSPGTYTIEPYESVGTGPKALKILKATDPLTGQKVWYYVEARQLIGFDASLAGDDINVINGLLVHTATEGDGNSNCLLDMTPATPTYYWWFDPAITVGQTFGDPETGVTITATAVNATGAIVSVNASATVSSLDFTLSTDKTTYSAGQSALITATVQQGSTPVAKAEVNLRITKPDGTVVSYTGTTDRNGSAIFRYRIGKKDPVGLYQATAVATKDSESADATASFSVM